MDAHQPVDGPASFGPYAVQGVLGRGGSGVVYRAVHRETGASSAVKTVRLADRRRLLLLRREVRALRRLDHPGIVHIVDDGVEDEVPWYAMDLVEGTPIDKHVRRLGHVPRSAAVVGDSDRSSDSWGLSSEPELAAPVPPIQAEVLQEILAVARRLCEALAYLHGEGLVHRDLKPGNVLVRADGTPVLVDLGLSSHGGSSGAIDDAIVRGGTLVYMAPEQILGEVVDARADLYSLGVILYELLTGRPPFLSRSVRELVDRHLRDVPRAPATIVPELPTDLDALVLRLLAKDRRLRFGHAEDVAAVLGTLGARDVPSPAKTQPRAYLYVPSLTGRDDAIATLRSAMEGIAKGAGVFVAIGGESGIGKTRVAMDAVRLAAEREIRVVAGECPESSPPLSAFASLLQSVADRCRERGGAETAQLLGHRARVLAAYAPDIERLPGARQLPEPVTLPVDAARLRLFLYLAEVLETLTRAEPHLLVIDDMQWADELSLEALRFLLSGRLRRLRLAVIGTYRADETSPALSELVATEGVVSLSLSPLPDDGVAQMVSDMLALSPAPPVFARHVARLSQGNPFFVAEYLRAAVAEGVLWRDARGLWQVAEPGSRVATAEDYQRLPLPGALRQLLARRLSRLGPEAMRVVDALAALGGEGSPSLLAKVARLPEDALLAGITELFERQVLVEAAGGAVRFLHERIRGVAYSGIGESERVVLHRRAAEELDEVRGDEALLAWHWERANEVVRARAALRVAAARARARSAHGEAERHLRNLLRLSPELGSERIEARDALGDLLSLVGRVNEARSEHESAREEARLLGLSAREGIALRRLGVLEHESGRLPEARARFEEALAICQSIGDAAAEGDATRSLANVLVHEGKVDDAEMLYLRALQLQRSAGNSHGVAVTLGAMGIAHFERGDLDGARRLLEEAVTLKYELGDWIGLALTLGNLGALHARQGRLVDARTAYEQALEIKVRTGDRRGEAVVLGNLGALDHDQGLHALALDRFQRSRAIHREIGSLRVDGIVTANIGSVLTALGRLGEAAAAYDEALAIHRQVGNRKSEAIALTMLAELQHADGKDDEARSSYDQALAIHRALGNRRDEATALRGVAELRRRTGDLAGAEEAAGRAVELLREATDRMELALALCAQGHVTLAQGRSARPILDETLRILAELVTSPGSAVGRAVERLSRAEGAFEAGAFDELVRGERRRDVPRRAT